MLLGAKVVKFMFEGFRESCLDWGFSQQVRLLLFGSPERSQQMFSLKLQGSLEEVDPR